MSSRPGFLTVPFAGDNSDRYPKAQQRPVAFCLGQIQNAGLPGWLANAESLPCPETAEYKACISLTRMLPRLSTGTPNSTCRPYTEQKSISVTEPRHSVHTHNWPTSTILAGRMLNGHRVDTEVGLSDAAPRRMVRAKCRPPSHQPLAADG